MRGVNKVIIVGTLGQDPEARYTQGGDAVASLSLATNESWKDRNGQLQEKTEWHRVVLWKKLAELAVEYLKKGSSIYLEGKLATRKWQDQTGQDRYTTEIVGNSMQFLSSGGGQSSNEGSKGSGGVTGNPNLNPDGTPKTPQQIKGNAPEPDFNFDDDIPF